MKALMQELKINIMIIKSKIINRFKINFFIMLPMVLGVLLAVIAGLYFNLLGLAMLFCY